jgi:hypothetical protein
MGCGASHSSAGTTARAQSTAQRPGGAVVAAAVVAARRHLGNYLIRRVTEPEHSRVSDLRSVVEELMVTDGFDINYADEKGWTAYHHACERGSLQVVVVLLGCGCDTARCSAIGHTGWARARRGAKRAASMAQQEACAAMAAFLEGVAKKGEHVNLRFEWAAQMLEEGSRHEAERSFELAHASFKVGAARLSYRATQLTRRAKVLLMDVVSMFGPEPEPELTGFEPVQGAGSGGRGGRHPLPVWGAAAVASFLAAVFTEIYLCGVCSCQETLRRNGRGQCTRPSGRSCVRRCTAGLAPG